MLDLQTAMVIIGIVVVGMVYLISKWDDRLQPSTRKRSQLKRPHGYAPPTLNRFDPLSDDEPPLFEVPERFGHEHALPEQQAWGQQGSGQDVVEPEQHVDLNPYDDDYGDVGADDLEQHEDTLAEETFVEESTSPAVPQVSASADKTTEFRVRNVEGFDKLGQIDYWVKITGAHDVDRKTVFAIYGPSVMEFTKLVRIHGLKIPENEWCNLEEESDEARFSDIVLSIQLADKNGPISDREMARFSDLVSALSEGTGREFKFMTSIENAFEQANAINEFMKHFASVFVVNIQPQAGEQFTGMEIERCASKVGMTRDENNFYSRTKPVNKNTITLYSLADMSDSGRFDFKNISTFSTNGLCFFTRIVVNNSPGAAYTEMVGTAKSFTARIKGEATAPDADDLSEEQIESTRQTIEQIAREMEQVGIPAGSKEAMRLF